MSSKAFLLLGIITMTFLLTACEDEMLKTTCDQVEIATIRDLTGLDG